MGNTPTKYTNNDISPLDIDENPWVYENENTTIDNGSYSEQQNKIEDSICIQDNCQRKSKKNYYCGYHRNKAYNKGTDILRDDILLNDPTTGTMCICGCKVKHIINSESNNDVGKFMLFYNKNEINKKWKLAQQLYRENKLNNVTSMKCSTSFRNSRASNLNEGVIILYCNNSSDEEKINIIGKNILKIFNYEDRPYIYYKTDKQTKEGTRSTGNQKNYTYMIQNETKKKTSLNRNNLTNNKSLFDFYKPVKTL